MLSSSNPLPLLYSDGFTSKLLELIDLTGTIEISSGTGQGEEEDDAENDCEDVVEGAVKGTSNGADSVLVTTAACTPKIRALASAYCFSMSTPSCNCRLF